MAAITQAFCPVCCTEHDRPSSCPGDLRATGPEVPGWRVIVETPSGNEAIGVLLAPSHDQWRARIVTYPNVLWMVPGGRGTLKFVGDTAATAEAQAIAFIEGHVLARRYLRRDAMTPLDPRAASRPELAPSRMALTTARRKLRRLPVRFGLERTILRGMTFNLSAEGLFVVVASPADGGVSLLIHLDLDGHTLPLRGLVMWNRLRAEPERPVGMGIRLSDPPPFYQTYVAALP
jgi:hypothetical protein